MLLAGCTLCPRRCGVNRIEGERGACQTGARAMLASYSPHFGEERPLSGTGGSGTIFFGGCNLHCLFCQNYEISHLHGGEPWEVDSRQLASVMVELQEMGCHNINFVTASHMVAQILGALPLAVEMGLTVPLVYNSSGYDSVHTLRMLDGVIDIYMPDFKFWNRETAKAYTEVADYPERTREAIREMHRQVGDLQLERDGLAWRGLLVRHLLMPDGLTETEQILHFIATEISPSTYVNIMGQYHPCGRAGQRKELQRGIRADEVTRAEDMAKSCGLTRLDKMDILGLLQRLSRDL